MGLKLLPVLLVLAVCLALPVAAPRAQDAPPPPGCTVGQMNMGPQGKGDFSIACTGISEALGNQLSDIANRIVTNRLDARSVLAKLDDVGQITEEGVSRVVDDNQRQKIVQNLVGKPPQQIAITAHPTVVDSAEVALSIASALTQAGWQIEGQQIKRMAPKLLDLVTGIAIIVKSPGSPPAKAAQLKSALAAATVTVPYVADPAMAPDAAMLWIGRRPVAEADQPK